MQDIISEYSGSKLKEKRETALLTQEELAEKLGVTSITISLWEHEKMVPTKKNLRKLREFFSNQ